MLELLDSSTKEPSARQLRDEFEHVLRHQLRQHLDAASMLADLLGEDASTLFERKLAKRQSRKARQA